MNDLILFSVMVLSVATDPIVLVASVLAAIFLKNLGSIILAELAVGTIVSILTNALLAQGQLSARSTTWFFATLVAAQMIGLAVYAIKRIVSKEPKHYLDGTEILTKNLDAFPHAKMLLTYSKDARKIWDEVQTLPADYHNLFLSQIEEDPKQDLRKLLSDIISDISKLDEPFDDPALNIVFKEAAQISPLVAAELKKAIEILGENVDPVEVLETIKNKTKAAKVLREAAILSSVSEITDKIESVGYQVTHGEIEGIGWLVAPNGQKSQYTGLSVSDVSTRWTDLRI